MDTTNLQAGFVTTRWTQVLAARGDSDSARIALSELCSSYYGPVVAYLTHAGCGTEEPREVAHEFFASLLARNGLASVDRERGRFRSYLLGALKHFIANRRLRASREKRGADVEHQSIDAGTETNPEIQIPAADSLQVEALFDREWALSVVERALGVMNREAALGGSGTEHQFNVLKPWLSFESDPGSQAAAAAELGINEGAVKVAVHRLRRRFRELVRAEIAQTVPEGEDVAAELRHLIDSLARG